MLFWHLLFRSKFVVPVSVAATNVADFDALVVAFVVRVLVEVVESGMAVKAQWRSLEYQT